MAEVQQASSAAVGRVFFKGRITGVRKAGQLFLTLCKLPAPDEYSTPSTVEIASKQRIGSVGDDFKAMCQVAGYSRSYERKNDDGDKETIHTADHRFNLIEG